MYIKCLRTKIKYNQDKSVKHKFQQYKWGENMFIFTTLANSEEDRTKLEQIYIKYKNLMYYIANDILHNTHESEDAVQSSIIKIANYIEKIDDINCNKTKSLIVTIVKSTSIDIYRKKKDNYNIDIDEVSYRIESNEIPLDDVVIRLDQAKELSEKLSKLKNEYANILTLKYYHQFSDKEIAGVLNITNENARIRLYRAKVALKQLMLKDQ